MRRSAAVVAVILVAVLALAACSSSGSSLTGKSWQWTAATTKVPASQSVVPNPEKYTIEFKSDGTFSAKADCNQVAGGYTTTSSGGLTITPGPSTLVACGADSLGDMYVAGLAMAASYKIASGQLTMTLSDEGTMTFK